ncbi:SDR family NAD(P)-dependent oxidoreductase [Chloroflexota bacterium]
MSNEHKEVSGRESVLDKFRLPGKVALVTGAARGIGQAISLALAEAGADVIVDDRTLEDLEEVTQQISQLGRRALPIAANIRHLPEIEDMVKKSVEEFGHIDILANNAGTNPHDGSMMDAEEWAWDVTMEVNLKGAFFVAQAVARVMKEHGGGSIINTASTAGLGGGGSIYGVSKAGLIRLTQGLAHELGQYGIRVNAVAPGVIKTRFSQAWWGNPAMAEKSIQGNPLRRLGEPEDIARAVLFLASDASSYVNGQTIAVAGG